MFSETSTLRVEGREGGRKGKQVSKIKLQEGRGVCGGGEGRERGIVGGGGAMTYAAAFSSNPPNPPPTPPPGCLKSPKYHGALMRQNILAFVSINRLGASRNGNWRQARRVGKRWRRSAHCTARAPSSKNRTSLGCHGLDVCLSRLLRLHLPRITWAEWNIHYHAKLKDNGVQGAVGGGGKNGGGE